MSLLDPQNIAVIGASSEPGKVGYEVLRNLLSQGYKGKIFAVNPKHPEILNHPAHSSVGAIEDAVDLAIIITPAKTVPGILKECGAKKIRNVVVISAGFKEAGTEEGKALEREVLDIVTAEGITLIGPNCLGVLRPRLGMNASFARELPPAGGIALASQSGAFAVALLDASPALGLGYSAVLSIGNKTNMDECDVLRLLADDTETRVIGLYLESITRGEEFLRATGAITKPIVLLKAGTSSFGQRAAVSHTGALAGSDAAIDAACREAGIHRAHTLEEFTDLLAVLNTQPSLPTNHIAVITNAGGPGILAADAAEQVHLSLPSLGNAQEKALRTKLPATAGTKNPIDVVGDAGTDRYEAALDAVCTDPGIDGVAVLLTPQVMTPCAAIAEAVVAAKKRASLMPVVASFMGGESVKEALEILREGSVPNFPTPERAIAALSTLRQQPPFGRAQDRLRAAAKKTNNNNQPHPFAGAAPGLLPEDLTQRLLTEYGIPTPAQALAHSPKEAVNLAEVVGYPVVLKISAPEILHKTDVGGIRIGVRSAKEVADAYTEIEQAVAAEVPDAHIRGILVQKHLPAGHEFIIGATKDASFGRLIMVGLGGIYTELFRDTAFRIAPVSEEEAYQMLQELTAWKLLLGARGKDQADIPALADLLTKISRLVLDHPEISDLDCNPVLVNEKGVVIADAKIMVG